MISRILILALLCLGSGVSASAVEHQMLVFVQATNHPTANQRILAQYVWPVLVALEKSGMSFQVTMYPITSDTASATSFFMANFEETLEGRASFNRAKNAFRRNPQALDGVYPSRSASGLVDLLGSVFIIDEALGAIQRRKPSLFDRARGARPKTFVIYISDMVQRTGFRGCDFSARQEGPGVEKCALEAPKRYGAKMNYGEHFSDLEILFIYADMKRLYTAVGLPSSPLGGESSEIRNFWRNRFFGSIFGVPERQIRISSEEDPTGDLEEFLKY